MTIAVDWDVKSQNSQTVMFWQNLHELFSTWPSCLQKSSVMIQKTCDR